MSSTKLFLTGATGFIGFHVLLKALQDGHDVIFSTRSESRAASLKAHPVIKSAVSRPDQLTSVIIEDITLPNIYDEALKGVTQVIHMGSPIGLPHLDPYTEVYLPTVKSVESLLDSAKKVASIKRVVITSSWYGWTGFGANLSKLAEATGRPPMPEPFPEKLADGGEAYTLGKRGEMHASDAWVSKNKPHFTVHQIVPGWVFGEDRRLQTAADVRDVFSTNGVLLSGINGEGWWFDLFRSAVHLDDVRDLHLAVALDELPVDGPRDFGTHVDAEWAKVWEYAAAAYPQAVEKGILKHGKLPSADFRADSSDAERLLGHRLKDFKQMVLDVAGQYVKLMETTST